MDVETAVLSWSAEQDHHPREVALVASVEGPRGRQTLAIVAHGLMGQGGAPIPASLVIETARRRLAAAASSEEDAAPEEALDAMARAAQVALREVAKREVFHMGATFAAAWFSGGRVGIAHSGDCQVYRRRAGEGFVKLTVDHSLVEEIRRLHPDLWSDELAEKYRNVIVRHLGLEDATSSPPDGAPAEPRPAWEISGADARPGDIFLLVTREVAEGAETRAPPFDVEAGEALEGTLARYFEALPRDGKWDMTAAAVRIALRAVDLVPERIAGAGWLPDYARKLLAK